MKKSEVWLEFTKVKADGTISAICKHCGKSLTGNSENGTSHLMRHLKKSCKMRPREDASTENHHKNLRKNRRKNRRDANTNFQSSVSGDSRARPSSIPQHPENHPKKRPRDDVSTGFQSSVSGGDRAETSQKRPREDTSTENQSSISNDNRAWTGEPQREDASSDFEASTNFTGATAFISENTAVFVSWVQTRIINVDSENQRLTLIMLFKLSKSSIKAINVIKAIKAAINERISKRNVVEAPEEPSSPMTHGAGNLCRSISLPSCSSPVYWSELGLILSPLRKEADLGVGVGPVGHGRSS